MKVDNGCASTLGSREGQSVEGVIIVNEFNLSRKAWAEKNRCQSNSKSLSYIEPNKRVSLLEEAVI